MAQQLPPSNEIVDENPNYSYAFEVADDEEQVYHGHKQSMEDKVSHFMRAFKLRDDGVVYRS